MSDIRDILKKLAAYGETSLSQMERDIYADYLLMQAEQVQQVAAMQEKIERSENVLSTLIPRGTAQITRLDQLARDLGDQIAGRFISPAEDSGSTEPTNSAFSGMFFSGRGETFFGQEVNFGGVDLGVLQIGIRREDGILMWGEGTGFLTKDGLIIVYGTGDANKIRFAVAETGSVISEIYAIPQGTIPNRRGLLTITSVPESPAVNVGGSMNLSAGFNDGSAVAHSGADINLSGGTTIPGTQSVRLTAWYPGSQVRRFIANVYSDKIILGNYLEDGTLYEALKITELIIVLNNALLDRDFQVKGATDSNLIYADASTDRVGIGKSNPAYKLDVNGAIAATSLYIAGTPVPIIVAYSTVAPTSGNITATANYVYSFDLSGQTADVNFLIPSGSAGDKIRMYIATGDDTYALVLKGDAGVSVGGAGAAAEWGRLSVAGEYLDLECFAANTWRVRGDGRYNDERKNGGWIPANETWTRTANHTFTVSGDVTARYRKGAFVRYKDGGSYEYGVIASSAYSSPNTTVELIPNDDYAMAAATITDRYISYIANPEGFPTTFNFTPTYSNGGTGSISGMTTTEAIWQPMGRASVRVVVLAGSATVTGSVTSLTATLPVTTVSATNDVPAANYLENGVGTPRVGTGALTTTTAVVRKPDSSAFATGSGAGMRWAGIVEY